VICPGADFPTAATLRRHGECHDQTRFLRSPDQEKELRKAAAALPDEWTIEMSAGLSGVKPAGAWDLRVFGPDFDNTASFGPEGVDAAMRLLKRLNPPR
jgi:hypothetical protein